MIWRTPIQINKDADKHCPARAACMNFHALTPLLGSIRQRGVRAFVPVSLHERFHSMTSRLVLPAAPRGLLARLSRSATLGMAALAALLPALSYAAPAGAFEAEPFGTLANGQKVSRYTLRNKAGLTVQFLSYGGVITAISTPDKTGKQANIVLGFPTLEGYTRDSAEGSLFFGALVGRYANRIAGAAFNLDGTTYHLPATEPPNTLHGGRNGFDKKIWSVKKLSDLTNATGAELTLVSPDGDEGFPGTLTVRVSYILDDSNRLSIRYRASTDRPTVLNLTNHSYFNLSGEGSGTVENHVLTLNADHYTPTDEASIPTGDIAKVENTPLDFRSPTRIGERLRSTFGQMRHAHGYDHNWVLSPPTGPAPRLAATLTDPATGRTLSVFTTQPGIQVYTGNSLDGRYAGPSGQTYRQTDGIALETQFFPDSPHHANFPSTVLRPGEEFDHTTVFAFGVEP